MKQTSLVLACRVRSPEGFRMPAHRQGGRWRWGRRPFLLLAWIGLLAAVMRVTPEPPAALVLMPSDDSLANLPDGTGLIAAPLGFLVLQGTGETFVADLYAAGAGLVLPARRASCLSVAGV